MLCDDLYSLADLDGRCPPALDLLGTYHLSVLRNVRGYIGVPRRLVFVFLVASALLV